MINQLTEITLPVVKIGRPTAESKALYQRQLDRFCEHLIKLKSSLDFIPSINVYVVTYYPTTSRYKPLDLS